MRRALVEDRIGERLNVDLCLVGEGVGETIQLLHVVRKEDRVELDWGEQRCELPPCPALRHLPCRPWHARQEQRQWPGGSLSSVLTLSRKVPSLAPSFVVNTGWRLSWAMPMIPCVLACLEIRFQT